MLKRLFKSKRSKVIVAICGILLLTLAISAFVLAKTGHLSGFADELVGKMYSVGDINQNGMLDSGDTVKIQRIVSGLDAKPADICLYDVNNNKQIDSGDVNSLQRILVNLDPKPTKTCQIGGATGKVSGTTKKALESAGIVKTQQIGQNGGVYGQVIHPNKSKAIEAEVSLDGSGWVPVREDNAYYDFGNLTAGLHTLSAREVLSTAFESTFYKKTQSITLVAGMNIEVILQLEIDTSSDGTGDNVGGTGDDGWVDHPEEAVFNLDGVVLDSEDREPLENVNVSLKTYINGNFTEIAQKTTSPSGKYQFTNVHIFNSSKTRLSSRQFYIDFSSANYTTVRKSLLDLGIQSGIYPKDYKAEDCLLSAIPFPDQFSVVGKVINLNTGKPQAGVELKVGGVVTDKDANLIYNTISLASLDSASNNYSIKDISTYKEATNRTKKYHLFILKAYGVYGAGPDTRSAEIGSFIISLRDLVQSANDGKYYVIKDFAMRDIDTTTQKFTLLGSVLDGDGNPIADRSITVYGVKRDNSKEKVKVIQSEKTLETSEGGVKYNFSAKDLDFRPNLSTDYIYFELALELKNQEYFINYTNNEQNNQFREYELSLSFKDGFRYYYKSFNIKKHVGISGIVKSQDDGSPIQNVELRLYEVDTKNNISTLRSLNNGRFEFPNLKPAAKYHIEAWYGKNLVKEADVTTPKEGFVDANILLSQKELSPGGTPFTIIGTATLANGIYLENVGIAVRQNSIGDMKSVASLKQGVILPQSSGKLINYHLDNIPVNDELYIVTFTPPAGMEFADSGFNGVRTFKYSDVKSGVVSFDVKLKDITKDYKMSFVDAQDGSPIDLPKEYASGAITDIGLDYLTASNNRAISNAKLVLSKNPVNEGVVTLNKATAEAGRLSIVVNSRDFYYAYDGPRKNSEFPLTVQLVRRASAKQSMVIFDPRDFRELSQPSTSETCFITTRINYQELLKTDWKKERIRDFAAILGIMQQQTGTKPICAFISNSVAVGLYDWKFSLPGQQFQGMSLHISKDRKEDILFAVHEYFHAIDDQFNVTGFYDTVPHFNIIRAYQILRNNNCGGALFEYARGTNIMEYWADGAAYWYLNNTDFQKIISDNSQTSDICKSTYTFIYQIIRERFPNLQPYQEVKSSSIINNQIIKSYSKSPSQYTLASASSVKTPTTIDDPMPSIGYGKVKLPALIDTISPLLTTSFTEDQIAQGLWKKSSYAAAPITTKIAVQYQIVTSKINSTIVGKTATKITSSASAAIRSAVSSLNATVASLFDSLYGKKFLVGDTNQNGTYDSGDSIKIQRVVVGLDPKPADICLYDTNNSGAIDIGDATKAMRYLTGLDPKPTKTCLVKQPWSKGNIRFIVVDEKNQRLSGLIIKASGLVGYLEPGNSTVDIINIPAGDVSLEIIDPTTNKTLAILDPKTTKINLKNNQKLTLTVKVKK